MNFSLKKAGKPPPRLKLGEADAAAKPEPQKVREVGAAPSRELEITLPSNDGWLETAAELQVKHTVELDIELQMHSDVAEDVLDDEVFRSNLYDLPEAPTTQSYDEISVEDFGAALLRGIGRDPDAKNDEPPRIAAMPKRAAAATRPALGPLKKRKCQAKNETGSPPPPASP